MTTNEPQTIKINYKLATLNDHDKANRANKYGGAALKRRETDAVTAQIISPKKMEVPVIVTFNWLYSSKHDFDNIRHGCKYVLDGLVKAGVLENDNQKWVVGFGGDFFTEVPKGQEGVIVELDPA